MSADPSTLAGAMDDLRQEIARGMNAENPREALIALAAWALREAAKHPKIKGSRNFGR